MRSVAVVLPASMWAMIPMFRVFSRGYSRATTFSPSHLAKISKAHDARNPFRPDALLFEAPCFSGRGTGVRRASSRQPGIYVTKAILLVFDSDGVRTLCEPTHSSQSLPAVMRERLV